MTFIPPLNDTQRQLVENNLFVVQQAIRKEIIVNEGIFGFEYDDLFQEGCIWLCKAAVSYRPDKEAQFSTFARKVISNGLKTYCRLMCSKQKKLLAIPSYSDPEDSGIALDQFATSDSWDDILASLDAMLLLDMLKHQYTGTVRLGLEAIEWKVKGYSGVEIAAMYGVKPNLVGAWISRAARKLEQNSIFTQWREQNSQVPA